VGQFSKIAYCRIDNVCSMQNRPCEIRRGLFLIARFRATSFDHGLINATDAAPSGPKKGAVFWKNLVAEIVRWSSWLRCGGPIPMNGSGTMSQMFA